MCWFVNCCICVLGQIHNQACRDDSDLARRCKTSLDVGNSEGVKTQSGCMRSNYDLMQDQSATLKLANAEADGGWWVHTAQDTHGRTAATNLNPCIILCPVGRLPRPAAAAGSRRNVTRQAVAAMAGM